MTGAPRIPGLERYPDLQKRYEAAYRAARARYGCGGCGATRGVIREFRGRLDDRQRRDK